MDFEVMRRGLRAEDVFTDPAHKWKTKRAGGWKGACPWHESKSGTCFHVNPETLDWHCFSCERGGGPLEYAAELEGLGAGAAFLEKWEALSERAGCPGPQKRREKAHAGRDPLKRLKTRTKTRAAKAQAGGDSAAGPVPAAPKPRKARGDRYSERELRRQLVRYREALKESERARAYLESRGLTIGTLYQYGCGYATPGKWLEDHIRNEKKT